MNVVKENNNKMIWEGSAPSNIALIKYMGKLDFEKNIPSNPSFSYTLGQLRTFVQIEKQTNTQDSWEPLKKDGSKVDLSEKGQKRFLSHFAKLKSAFDVKDNFIIRSANNFPSDSGLASSASSFAALTLTAAKAFTALGYKNTSGLELYELSREGSGSSCRSFFDVWAMWNGTKVSAVELKIQSLEHQVVLVDSLKKEVSSGDAHKRVETSLLNCGRGDRARLRLENLIKAFETDDWTSAYEIIWAEFWDMHALFETSHPAFRYMSSKSLEALNFISQFWKFHKDGPLVTMDAGPNIHLLWREDQKSLKEKFVAESKFQFLKLGM